MRQKREDRQPLGFVWTAILTRFDSAWEQKQVLSLSIAYQYSDM